MPTVSQLDSALESVRLELLDLTGRNRLLNTSRSEPRSSRVEIVDEVSNLVFQRLAIDGNSMTFVASDENDASPNAAEWEVGVDAARTRDDEALASREWIAGVLDPERVGGEHYFGNTALAEGEMFEWVGENIGEVDEEEQEQMAADVEMITAALSAEAHLKSQIDLDASDADKITEGRSLISEVFGCIDCHKFGDEGELGAAPDLTGYGSRQWLVDFISDPKHIRFYNELNDRMPSFAEDPVDPDRNQLDAQSIGHLVDRPPRRLASRRVGGEVMNDE